MENNCVIRYVITYNIICLLHNWTDWTEGNYSAYFISDGSITTKTIRVYTHRYKHLLSRLFIWEVGGPAVLLHRRSWFQRQPSSSTTSTLMSSALPSVGGERRRKRAEREKVGEETGCCLLWQALTHRRVTAAGRGRTERPSILLFRKTKLTFWIIETPLLNKRLYIIKRSPRQTRGGTWASGARERERREAAWQRSGSSAPRTATMAPMVEEGAQLGESI